MSRSSAAAYLSAMPDPEPPVSPLPPRELAAPAEVKHSLWQQFAGWLRARFLGRSDAGSIKDVIEEILEEHEDMEGAEEMAPEEKTMLRNMLSFGETQVEDIMVPRADIVGVAANVTLPELKKHILEQRHTRMPVYEGTLDTIKGFVHIKDLLPMLAEDVFFNLKAVLRKPLFVPPSMTAADLLHQMRRSGEHLAIVVDEYGGTDGLVTMEDVMEQIVGDIQDEHDEEVNRPLAWARGGVVDVSARIPVKKLEEELGLSLAPTEGEEQEYDTLGGLIFYYTRKVPSKGEIIAHPSGITFEILDADPRRIRLVRIRKTRPALENSTRTPAGTA